MIWCVEDDAGIREIEVYTLNSTGLDARGLESADDAIAALQTEKPDLILLDIMLPGTDGVTLLRTLRERNDTRDIPVIMATAKGQEYDKVESLDMGADDYLVKPFGMMEMVSRVKAVLRRCRKPEKQTLTCAGIQVNVMERTVLVDGQKTDLTYKEFELLVLFLKSPNRVFTRDELMNTIWGSDYMGETRTVDMHISTLRVKLGRYGEKIKTVRNVGYRLEDA